MNEIIINNLENDCERFVEIENKTKTVFSIDPKYKSITINPGKHIIKIKKHHDFFIDWFVDNMLVEEFVLFDLVSDNESVLVINSSDCIDMKESEEIKKINKQNDIPFYIHFNNEIIEFNLICVNPSQISFFMQKEKDNIISRGNDYYTLTLAFFDSYCNVYLDEFKNNKFEKQLRQNLSFFKFEKEKNNKFIINKKLKTIKVINELNEKQYNLEKFFNNEFEYFYIEETYVQKEPGKYKILY